MSKNSHLSCCHPQVFSRKNACPLLYLKAPYYLLLLSSGAAFSGKSPTIVLAGNTLLPFGFPTFPTPVEQW